MDSFIYFWCFVVIASMSVLFFPLFIFFACVAGIIMIASLLL